MLFNASAPMPEPYCAKVVADTKQINNAKILFIILFFIVCLRFVYIPKIWGELVVDLAGVEPASPNDYQRSELTCLLVPTDCRDNSLGELHFIILRRFLRTYKADIFVRS